MVRFTVRSVFLSLLVSWLAFGVEAWGDVRVEDRDSKENRAKASSASPGEEVPGDPQRGLELVRRAAERGDRGMQRMLAHMYKEGAGEAVPKDEKEAAYFASLLATVDEAEVQFISGARRLLTGIPADKEESMHLLRLAADKGNAGAQFALGGEYIKGYFEGERVAEDVKEGVRLLRLAANQGYKDAKDTLEKLGLQEQDQDSWENEAKAPSASPGEEVPDEEIASLRLAADQGDAKAQFHLGAVYFMNKDFKKAVHYFRLAVDQDFIEAAGYLGRMYSEGLGVDKDVKKAERLLRLSADKGDRAAQLHLGMLYVTKGGELFNMGLEDAFREAVRLWRLSGDQGNKDAQFALGVFYRRLGGDEGKKKADSLLRLAADQGHKDAQDFLERGPVNYPTDQLEKETARIFRRAAEQGEAQARLEISKAQSCQAGGEGEACHGAEGVGVSKSSGSRLRLPFWVPVVKSTYQGLRDGGSWMLNAIGSRLDAAADRVTDRIVRYASSVVRDTPHYHTQAWHYGEDGEIDGVLGEAGVKALGDDTFISQERLAGQAVSMLPSSSFGSIMPTNATMPLISGGGF